MACVCQSGVSAAPKHASVTIDYSNFEVNLSKCDRCRATGRDLAASREGRRFSRIVAYLIIMGSFLALCNAAVQPVSSQVFYTSTSTQTNTETYFTVSEVTANLSVTVFTVQYTTSTSLLTFVNVQFTTLTYTTVTSNITNIQIIQSAPERALKFPSSSQSAASVRAPASIRSRAPPDGPFLFFGYVEPSLVLEMITCSLVLIASILLVLKKRK